MIYEKGSSVTIDLNSAGVLSPMSGAPTNPVAWKALGTVPFVNLAEVTFTSEGVGDGFFIGRLRPLGAQQFEKELPGADDDSRHQSI